MANDNILINIGTDANNKQPWYRWLVVWVVIISLYLPLMYLLGVKDITFLYGAEPITSLPSLQNASFLQRDFQKKFEAWWTSHFFPRKSMLRLKNQIYDWVNLGKMHSGYGGNVVSGKRGYLFERAYFALLNDQKLALLSQVVAKIRQLQDRLEKRGIEFYFILAPNKAVTYPEYVPNRYRYFISGDGSYHRQIEAELNRLGVRNFNAQALAIRIKHEGRYQPFAVTGTHWNHYAAGRAVQEAAKKFNWCNAGDACSHSGSVGAINMVGVEERSFPYSTERDIANLLNLLIKYYPKQTFYRPIFRRGCQLPGATTIIGNSFSNEFKLELINAGLGGEVFHYENAPLTAESIANIERSKRVILVYTDQAVLNCSIRPNSEQMLIKMDFLLRRL